MKRFLLMAVLVICCSGYGSEKISAQVRIDGGQVQGTIKDELTVYLGLPYAQPPVAIPSVMGERVLFIHAAAQRV